MRSPWSFWEKFAQQPVQPPPCQAFSSPMKGLLALICARRILSSGVANLALLTGAEITVTGSSCTLGRSRNRCVRSWDMLVWDCTEIPVVMCKLQGASRWFPEVRSGFLEKLSWPAWLPGLPSVPWADRPPTLHLFGSDRLLGLRTYILIKLPSYFPVMYSTSHCQTQPPWTAIRLCPPHQMLGSEQ